MGRQLSNRMCDASVLGTAPLSPNCYVNGELK